MYANLVFTNGIDAFYARCEHQVGRLRAAPDVLPVNGPSAAALRHNIASDLHPPAKCADDLLCASVASYGPRLYLPAFAFGRHGAAPWRIAVASSH